MNLTVREIIEAIGGEAHLKPGTDENEKVTGVVLDSRLVTEGGVFVAQKGERVDGHSFIGQVFEKGVSLVICEMDPEQTFVCFDTPADAWGSYVLVKDSLVALKQIAKAYRQNLHIPFVGITGSVGKTSTKEFIAGVLSEKYNVLKTEGNYNNEIGVPLTLLKIREEHEAAVVEMGISDFGEMTRLTEMVCPDIAVITNIGQCHLENLGTRDGILKAKTEIFKSLNKDGRAVLFGGDDKLVTVPPVNGKEPVFFGETGSVKALCAEVTGCEGRGLLGSKVEIALKYFGKTVFTGDEANVDETISVNVPLPGHHMVINAAAASAVALLLGLNADQIKHGIENMGTIAGRNNIITIGDITVIDDCYNANPVSMKSSIDLLMLAQGRTIAILGDMFELGKNEKIMHSDVGTYAVESGVNSLFCIGSLSEKMYEGAKETLASLKKDRDSDIKTEKISYWKTRDELIEAIREDVSQGKRELIPQGSSVLVKASHGMHFEELVNALKGVFKA